MCKSCSLIGDSPRRRCWARPDFSDQTVGRPVPAGEENCLRTADARLQCCGAMIGVALFRWSLHSMSSHNRWCVCDHVCPFLCLLHAHGQISVYVCLCMYACVCRSLRVRLSVCLVNQHAPYVSVCLCMLACKHACVHADGRACMRVHGRAYACICMLVHACACLCMHPHACMYLLCVYAFMSVTVWSCKG